jgi:antitoxin ParD1/3/4
MNIKKNTMPINVNLTSYLEKMVRDKVSSGRYTSASEVIREALRLMDEQDSIRKARTDLLQKEIQAGLESGTATNWNPEEIKKVARERAKA